MTEPNVDLTSDPQPERPLECSECRRAVAVRYTEVSPHMTSHTCMCAECPQLALRLFGTSSKELQDLTGEAALVCGNCGTTLNNVRMGVPLGCSHCYEVFVDAIFQELRVNQRLPSTVIIPNKKGGLVHVGRAPGEHTEISTTSRLAALNEALSETLTREDYEQAAWLRDQIKQLTESPKREKKDE